MSDQPSQSLWDVVEDLEKAESSGGAIFAKVNFQMGFKLFAPGRKQVETFFAFKPGDKASMAAATEAANKFLADNGLAGSGLQPKASALIQIYRDQVVGREVTWQDDRFLVYPIWTDDWKNLVKPALKEAGVNQPGEYYAKVVWADSVAGQTEIAPNGETRLKKIGHIVQIYSTREAIVAAAGADGAAAAAPAADPNVPSGWTADAWNSVKSEIKTAVATAAGGAKAGPKLVAAINGVAADYGVEASFVEKAFKEE